MKNRYLLLICIGLLLVYYLSGLFHFRIDLTADKKYTFSDYTKNLLKNLDSDIQVIIYLDGNLDVDYLRLKTETSELLDEYANYSPKKISYSFDNPNNAKNDKERQKQRLILLNRGMKDEILTETDNEGQMIQKSVFPWADVIMDKDTIAVCLLSNDIGKSESERINTSIEDLEFQFTNALIALTQKDFPEIAFLEGHEELPEIYVYDAVEELSRYYTVFRGKLTNEINEIPPYKALIIAGPAKPFSEREKYLIDRYIISGGSVLFLINSAKVSYEELQKTGQSASIVNDVNLDDLFFRYGFRINPVLIQDLQCAYIPLKIGEDNQTFHTAPWYYAPLLIPSSTNLITRNLAPVKAEFAGSIDFVGENKNIQKQVLLTSSAHTHLVLIPETISPDAGQIKETSGYFNKSYIPVAVLLEGNFTSAFNNRMLPDGIVEQPKPETKPGKILVAASGNIIRNEIQWDENKGTALPLGYDSFMDKQFGNRDFIVNAVNYLTGNETQMLLRNKHNTLRLLDKTKINSEKTFWQWLNLILPVGILITLTVLFEWRRRKKYGKKE